MVRFHPADVLTPQAGWRFDCKKECHRGVDVLIRRNLILSRVGTRARPVVAAVSGLSPVFSGNVQSD